MARSSAEVPAATRVPPAPASRAAAPPLLHPDDPGGPGPLYTGRAQDALRLQRTVGNRAVAQLIRPDRAGGGLPDATSGGHPVQRAISLAGVHQNTHSLSSAMAEGGTLTKVSPGYRLLWPIALEWLKKGDHEYASPAALRTALVEELTKRLIKEVAPSTPALRANLEPAAFQTVAYMTRFANFDPGPLEKAMAKVTAAAHIAQDTVAGAISPGKLPRIPATYRIFSEHDFAAMKPGVLGLIAEFETAAAIDPKHLRKGQKVRLSQDYQLGNEPDGERQDADVSYLASSGNGVLVEVAATIARLRSKLGADGAAQRERYERVRDTKHGVLLAYSVPNIQWSDFFAGHGEERVVTRLAARAEGWGLILDGTFVAQESLAQVSNTLDAVQVKNVQQTLQASKLSFAEVSQMDAKTLTARLKRYGG